MRFSHLQIGNFGRIENASVNLADRGLVLVQGDNRDVSSATSNGAGKSTVFEALSWALYGATAKGVSGDAVVRQGSKGGCIVSVRIEEESVRWVVARHRGHPKKRNSLEVWRIEEGGASKNVSLGTDKLTQGLVDRIVGCSYDVFTAAVYTGQEAMPDLPAMTDRNLKLLVEEAAGVQVLEAAYETARVRLTEATAAEGEALIAHNEADANCKAVACRLQDAEEAVSEWVSQIERERILVERSALEKQRTLKDLFTEFKETGGVEKIDAAVAVLDAKLAEVADQTAEQAKLRRLKSSIDAAAVEKKAVARHEDAALERAQVLLYEARDKGPGECSECGAVHSEGSHEDHLVGLAKKVSACALKSAEAAKDARLAASAAEKAAQRLEAFEAAMTDTTKLAAQRGSLLVRRAEIIALRARVQRSVAEVKAVQDELVRIDALENPYVAKVASLKELLSAGSASARVRAKAYEKAGVEKDVAKSVASVFAPAGVRAHILDTVTPYLNARTAHYLAALTDGFITATWTTLTLTAKGELREKFNIEVRDGDGVEGFASISGGEKRKVRLACALALQDLVASRAEKAIPLFIADEIDAALDEAGLERLMGVLEEKARERGSVFIISHNSLRDWCDNVMTVKREGGVSSLT